MEKPMIIAIKIFLSLVCGCLDAWGGYNWHNARRYLMPAVLALAVSIFTGVWWTGLMLLPTMGTLCIGYGKDGNFGRALWLGLQAFMLSIGLCVTGHIIWFLFIPYVVGACVLGGLYRNWNQIIGDLLTGSYLGMILFLVR